MKPKFLPVVAFSLISLVACQPSSPDVTAEAVSPAIDAGKKPDDADLLIKQYLHSVLRDPDSLKDFSSTEPRIGTYFVPVLQGGPKNVPAWYSCFNYNAKNGFGGYAGPQRLVAFFKQNRIIDVIDMQNTWSKYQC